jgi:hypothetical protein
LEETLKKGYKTWNRPREVGVKKKSERIIVTQRTAKEV